MTTRLLHATRQHGSWWPTGQRGDDKFSVTVPAGQQFDSCVLTIRAKKLNAGASISAKPSAGATGKADITVHWWYDGGSEIVYDLDVHGRVTGAPQGVTVAVPGFLPSTSGFHFSNSTFSDRPVIVRPTPFGNLQLGDASNGLCGGMVFATRDYFETRTPIPPGTDTPDSGPLFDYIIQRLFDSFNIPDGVIKYMELMNPALPDHETDFSRAGLAPRGRSWRMIVEEWPRIKADLDAGRTCPIGLVLLRSANFLDLGKNHQVLAYGYRIHNDDLTLRIYDPNKPDNDGIVLTIALSNPEQSKKVRCGNLDVIAFFRANYAFHTPPGAQGLSACRTALRSAANQKLVCAENAGAKELIANRAAVGPWETFEVMIVGSDRIALRSVANNRYVRAEDGGKRPLIANSTTIGPSETFELQYVPGNFVALKSLANGKYVCAENAGQKALIANRDAIGQWETFALVSA